MAYTKAPDAQLLQAALAGYEHQRGIVEERIAELRRELAGRVTTFEVTTNSAAVLHIK